VLRGRVRQRDCPGLALQALADYTAGMQYTLRNIPPELDSALRRRAKEEGRSLNEVALEALREGIGLGPQRLRRRDLSDLAGSWTPDAEFKKAIAEQDQIDEDLWK
jgi:plasmid stability protein